MDVAPSTALVSLRTNWTPYILSATEAVLNGHTIESSVPGHVHGRDISAGFDHDWVQILELNKQLAAPGTEDRLNLLFVMTAPISYALIRLARESFL